MKQKLNILLLFITIFFIPSLSGQDVAETNVCEELDFATDRKLYLSGENIWFRALVSVRNALGA
jgi:hypothetical protein